MTNQPLPLLDWNPFDGDAALRDALRALAPGLDTAALRRLGAAAGAPDWLAHARLANRHRPELHTHDRQGRRIDEVEFHPSYHALMTLAIEAGLHAAPWGAGGADRAAAADADTGTSAPTADDARPTRSHPHLERAAGFILATGLEPSVLCPVSMSYSAVPALRGSGALAAAWLPKLVARTYDPLPLPVHLKTGATMGMGMTERQGGSDLRANLTRARPDGHDAWGERWRLDGHKWFFSAPMSDAFLVLAQAPAGPTCFLVPRRLPDGTDNPLRLQRLKDKLGNHANASAEVEFDAALGWRVGDEGRGIAQILEMGTLTRIDCALGSAGLMRQALALAIDHTAQRRAFGRVLVDQPLMRGVLADLALESEAATALALRLAHGVDRREDGATPPDAAAHEPAHERALGRLLTPAAKFWICKRGSGFVQEAMECLGGNGYVESGGEGVMARLYRETPVNSIWEGAGNVMALDLLRALRRGAGRDTAPDPVDALLAELAAARGADRRFDRHADALAASLGGPIDERDARRIARDVALAMQAALLLRQAPPAVADAFCASRLGGAAGDGSVYGLLDRHADTDAIVRRAMPRPWPMASTDRSTG